MMTIELRRHTANEGDALTPAGAQAAIEIGRTLHGPYGLVVSSGAERATQAAECFVPGGDVVVEEGFRSLNEDRWREIYAATGRGDLQAFIDTDADFVRSESDRFVGALKRAADRMSDGGRALVVGHSPMIEATVWAATGEIIDPLGKGDGVVLIEDKGGFRLG